MKKLFLVALVVLTTWLENHAQTFGNEWIDYSNNRIYLKFPIAKNSIYRIDYNALNLALQLVNKNIANIDPRSIQVFAKGQEQYIYLEGESDGIFNTGDFIEFYGEKNDGWFDEQLYPTPNEQTNPFYSLYNDTIYYFLTWDPSGAFSNKRITQVPFNAPVSTPAPYLIYEKIKTSNANYSEGQIVASDKPVTIYTGGKGWASSVVGYNGGAGGGSFDLGHTLNNLYSQTNAPDIELSFGITSANLGANSDSAHHFALIKKVSNTSTILKDYIKPTYYFNQESYSLAATSASNNATFKIQVAKQGSLVNANADYARVSYFKVKYPKQLELSGDSSLKFYTPSSNIPYFFNVTGFCPLPVSIAYDLEGHKRIEVSNTTSNGIIKFNLDAGSERPIFVTINSKIINIGYQKISPAGDHGILPNLNLGIDSAYLFITHRSLESEVQSYSTYRSTNFNTAIIDIADLYEQYAYGINYHPLAIRNFVNEAISKWPSKPQYLFLVGKSISEDIFRKSSASTAQIKVPTIGFPSCDNMLTAGLDGRAFYVPAVPTGRIAANSAADVKLYLDKIKAQEAQQLPLSGGYTIDNKLWQKRVLHFAGGNNSDENKRFKSYLDHYAAYLTDTLMGAQRILFSKTSSNVIEQLDVDSVRRLIREGVAIMTFFGHGSGNNFDVSVDNPSEWGNEYEGKYPLVIANSCYSGNIHRLTSTPSISEEYVLTPNEGAIGFIATPYLSFEGQLDNYTTLFHKHLSSDMYGQTVGRFMQKTASQMSSDFQNSGVALEMTLHGDPALKVFPHAKPEISINDPNHGAAIRFEPSQITTDLDSFDVVITATNLGRSVTKPFQIAVSRNFESGVEREIQYQTFDKLNFSQEARFRFGIDKIKSIGKNWFDVTVDLPISSISEFNDYSNNEINRQEISISSADIFPIYPYNFAVLPNFEIELTASTGIPFLDEKTYVIQIDTIDTYDSPWKKDTTISQKGGVLRWNPRLTNFNFKDSTVFFYRVSPASDLSKWREHSFQIIHTKTGWGQDHFFQYKDNKFDFLSYDRSTRRFDFDSVSRTLFVNCLANPPLNNNEYLSNNRYTLDGQSAPMGETGVAPNGVPSLLIAVIDSTNLKPWGTYGLSNGNLINQNHQFGNTNNYNTSTSRGRRVEYWFSFQVNSASGLNNAVNLIQNEVQNGHYLLVYTSVKGLFQDTNYWKDAHYAAFEALGADSIRYIPSNNPYILLAKKGYPNTAIEVIGKNSIDPIQLNAKLNSNVQIGEITSTEIGPAISWDKVYFKSKPLEQNSFDQAYTKALLANTEVEYYSYTDNYETDISALNINSNGSINLRYQTKDTINSTPAQLLNWHVLYSPAPEAAINPNLGALLPSKNIDIGDSARFAIGFENVSNYGFKNFRVHYWLVNQTQEIVDQKWLYYDTCAPKQVIIDTVTFSTSKLSGQYTIWMEINPEDSAWHAEQYHFNNTAFSSFNVIGDTKNPLLDVTFDGIHILNGDIVSPSPEIQMVIKDENTILLMQDTSTFNVFLTYPNGMQKRISFIAGGQENMQFEPAVGQNNKAKLNWNPQNLADGKYTLHVMGRDAVGNTSGTSEYKIDFEVISRSTITSVLNYPNPFSTSTRFVFTLTGSKEPEIFTIQILTVTGKVVREITKEELGNIRIGRNISDFAWDGTDEFGDRLANGVYLYRVITKIGGESIELRSTSADQFFTKDFGKIYLFR